MHTMYVPIVLRYVRSILLVSCIFCQKERIHTFTHSSLLDPTTKNLLSPLTPDQQTGRPEETTFPAGPKKN